MKKQLLILLVCLSTFNLLAQDNLIPNGDMENWDETNTTPNDWLGFIIPSWQKNSDAQSGTSSLELSLLSNGGTSNFINSPNIQFIEGTTYTCAFYFKVLSGTFSKIEFNIRDASTEFPEDLLVNEFNQFSTENWTKGEFEFTASTAADIQAWIWIYGEPGSQMLIDNVSIFDKSTLSSQNFTRKETKISIYPNPSSVNIQLIGLETTQQYGIYDMSGRQVSKGKALPNANIDISTLNSGVYFIKTEQGGVSKFIKE
jgi:hypothetical protein